MNFAYSSNAYRRWSIEHAIDRVASAGYRGIELMADAPHLWPPDVTEQTIDTVRGCLSEAGLTVSNVNAFMMCGPDNADTCSHSPRKSEPPSSPQSTIDHRQSTIPRSPTDFWHPSWIEPDPALRRRRIRHTTDSLQIARRLGARCVTTEPGGPLPPGMSRSQAMDLFATGLNETLRVAEDVGVQLLVEPEPGLLIESAAQFRDLADRIDSPMFGLNFDVGHFYCVGDPLPETVAALRPWTRHYHLEDIAVTRVHEHLIPGRGAIDFLALFKAIRATGYCDWLTVELYPYLEDPDAAGREALDFLNRVIGR